jgi:hypothetical protein
MIDSGFDRRQIVYGIALTAPFQIMPFWSARGVGSGGDGGGGGIGSTGVHYFWYGVSRSNH